MKIYFTNLSHSVTSQQHQVDGRTSQAQSTLPSAVTISGNNVAEYVLPAGSNLIQQPTSGMVHVPVMNEEQGKLMRITLGARVY